VNSTNPAAPVEGDAAELLKLQAHATLEIFRKRLILLARRAFVQYLLRNETGTTDDVRPLIEIPDGINPTFFGAVPGPLARAGIIGKAGHRKCPRKEGHARENRVWELIDRDKAEQWLIDNPAPQDETPAENLEPSPPASVTLSPPPVVTAPAANPETSPPTMRPGRSLFDAYRERLEAGR